MVKLRGIAGRFIALIPRIESACLEGAKNVLKILNATKSNDKKALQVTLKLVGLTFLK